MENCSFCKVISGKYRASFSYRDDTLAAFLDIHPVNEGHMLIVPVKHVERISQLDQETARLMFGLAARIAGAVYRSGLPCEGINLMLSDGEVAGQEVPHCHLHVVPRLRGDSMVIKHNCSEWSEDHRARFDEVAALISKRL
ncbi:MAG: HIT family protein [Deltaproteobacteria bacterium]|nr:HIT family protein [Deltaproteobacteria bacterium]